MKAVKWFRLLLAQGCIVGSMVMIVIHILDWYNPFMNFAGHGTGIAYMLYGCAFLLGILDTLTGKAHQKSAEGRTL